MDKTNPFGLTVLAPGEPLSLDGYAFQGVDRRIIAQLLEIGARTHRHDEHAPLANPATPVELAAASTGGTLPGGTSLDVGYTLLDGQGLETALSEAEQITTPAALGRPEDAPEVTVDYAAGSLPANNYYYAITFTDAAGGQTPIGPSVTAVRAGGHPNGRVTITGMGTLAAAADANGWRLYRATGGGAWDLLAAGTTADTFIDDGSVPADCTMRPPLSNTTSATGKITVTMPSLPAGATGYRLYASADGSFDSPALIGTFTPGDAAAPQDLAGLALGDGAPPASSLSIGGAHKIDPDTELIDWHWKRPVATSAALPASGNDLGDVRVTEDTGTFWAWTSSGWVAGPSVGQPRRETHTWALAGPVSVSEKPGFFVSMPAGGAATIVGVRRKTGTGTATITVTRNGASIADFSALSVSTVVGHRTGTENVDYGDSIELSIDAATGAEDLQITVELDLTEA